VYINKWSSKYPSCINCKTTRRRRASRGYCTTCYYVIKKRDIYTNWDVHNPITFPKIYLSPAITESDHPQHESQIRFCLKQKQNYIRAYNKTLEFIMLHETHISQDTQGIALQTEFTKLARRSGVKYSKASLITHSLWQVFDNEFSQDQRNRLYGLLNDITENTRNWYMEWFYDAFYQTSPESPSIDRTRHPVI